MLTAILKEKTYLCYKREEKKNFTQKTLSFFSSTPDLQEFRNENVSKTMHVDSVVVGNVPA